MASEIAQLYARISGDKRDLSEVLASAKAELIGAGLNRRAVGMGLSLSVTLPEVGAGAAALAAAADFEQQQNNKDD